MRLIPGDLLGPLFPLDRSLLLGPGALLQRRGHRLDLEGPHPLAGVTALALYGDGSLADVLVVLVHILSMLGEIKRKRCGHLFVNCLV